MRSHSSSCSRPPLCLATSQNPQDSRTMAPGICGPICQVKMRRLQELNRRITNSISSACSSHYRAPECGCESTHGKSPKGPPPSREDLTAWGAASPSRREPREAFSERGPCSCHMARQEPLQAQISQFRRRNRIFVGIGCARMPPI